MVEWWQGLILGVVQGATEFLPISSSGHLALIQNLFQNFQQPGLLFDLCLHLATALAVVVYFRKELAGLISRGGKEQKLMSGSEKLELISWNLILVIIISLIPTAIVGFALKDFAESCFVKPSYVGGFLIFTGLILFFADYYARRAQNLFAQDPEIKRGLLIGLAQGISVLPGISRSGITIATGIFTGIRGDYSARFSFLLSVPAILGASFISLFQERAELVRFSNQEILSYLLGMASAFLVGYFSIKLVFSAVRRIRLSWFGIYCLVAGSTSLILSLFNLWG